jgi:hypothetical protein
VKRREPYGGVPLEHDPASETDGRVDVIEPDEQTLIEAAQGDTLGDGAVEDDKGKRRPYPERIAELDDRIEWLHAERRRLVIEYLAERAKAIPHLKPQARRLRALLRAGLTAKVDALVAELEAAIASFERRPEGPSGEPA